MAYRWLLLHRPHIGLIRLRIMEGENVITDSGNLFDSSFKGGRLGVMCFSQEMIIWSRLIYRCNGEYIFFFFFTNELPLSLLLITLLLCFWPFSIKIEIKSFSLHFIIFSKVSAYVMS